MEGGAAMPNKNLNSDELKHANELLKDIRERLTNLAAGDPLLLFAYRRKLFKELGYDERGKPTARAMLKALKWGQQNGRCAHCGDELPLKYSELDRKNAVDGYNRRKYRIGARKVPSRTPSGKTLYLTDSRHRSNLTRPPAQRVR